MTLHVLFTNDGIPAWIGAAPLEGSEPVEDMSIEFLAAHRRTPKGNWVARMIPEPVPPTPEEIAAEAEAVRNRLNAILTTYELGNTLNNANIQIVGMPV